MRRPIAERVIPGNLGVDGIGLACTKDRFQNGPNRFGVARYAFANVHRLGGSTLSGRRAGAARPKTQQKNIKDVPNSGLGDR